MIKAELIQRPQDKWGNGAFGAPRGKRKHRGIDFACLPGTKILRPVSGIISKLGYPYSDDLLFRYVEITTINDKARHRIFYITPLLIDGKIIRLNDVIGFSQDLTGRYQGITPHIHYEIIDSGGDYINPMNYKYFK